jgi:NADH-quinone oxidoreductase subunit J
MTTTLIFYFFAATLIFAAFRVITVRNPVHAALFLVLTFFSSAAIWLLLHAEFLAIALILVYVGAVMVLFLFVVMMLDINFAPLREGFAKHLPVGLTVGFLILIEMVMVVTHWKGLANSPTAITAEVSNTQMLGQVLYTVYVYPFEIAAAILLVAMIAAITLTGRLHNRAKYQKPEQQVVVRREDRVRLVNVPAEPKD